MMDELRQIGELERETQNRVVKLFQEEMDYSYLGNWEERENNSNIEVELLKEYLSSQGYAENLIKKSIDKLSKAAEVNDRSLYEVNKSVYELLRYGVKIKPSVGENTETIKVVDWEDFSNNQFYIAEEVTIKKEATKRPDIVIYVNGIALGVLELKRGCVSIDEGVRQSITNQQGKFIEPFFSTIQYIYAGNNSEGLKYGTIKTSEKYYMNWKEDAGDQSRLRLDKYLLKMCSKERFIELIRDFVLFDGGVKKLPRHHQYFGVKASQGKVRDKKGGVIWHTQGSGKSITMVLLAKWILRSNPIARVLILTDRTELDEQIERVFTDAGEKEIYRTSSGKDLMNQLAEAKPRLLCSLVHKFGSKGDLKEDKKFEAFIKELEENPCEVHGEIYVFVDECHRTQSGRLHKTMKAILGNPIFVGFTGTPLLKADKATTKKTFGEYIHTYKFDEAVKDEIILDLCYEARDVDQEIHSPTKIDEWFDVKTRGLNNFQKSQLRQKWATMQKVLSSRSRHEKIVKDIVYDFEIKQRLSSSRGNAMLVASSIYEACKYYELFQKSPLAGKCAVITSYQPSKRDSVNEDTGANTQTEKEYLYEQYTKLLDGSKTETYETNMKEKFVKRPAEMRLLIVVAKLLTGFDAPSCSYLYIDKEMQDHGLFQAICRVNRLDTEDKTFGYIVDYQDLFESVKGAIDVYTSETDDESGGPKISRNLDKAKEKLDLALEKIKLLCESVDEPKESLQYQIYFCGNPDIIEELKSTEIRRINLYKMVSTLTRAYSSISGELAEAGYSYDEMSEIEEDVNFYLKLKNEIKRASGETIDLKSYEADMRHLIDNYIEAKDSTVISPFDDLSLLELIAKLGIKEGLEKYGVNGNQSNAASTVERNIRKKLVDSMALDRTFYDEMSALLEEVVQKRKKEAIDYEKYLKEIAEIAKRIQSGRSKDVPESIVTSGQIALYNNFGKDVELALNIDRKVKRVKKADFRGNKAAENEIKRAIYEIVEDEELVGNIFELIKNHDEY
mgnify:CR=1 FL=1